MRKQYFALLFGATAFLGSPAAAASMTGARAELRGGWDRTTIGLNYDDGVNTVSGDAHDDGFNLGAEVGFDAPIGQAIIAGAYAGIEAATTKECGALYGNDEICLKLGRNLTLGARVGAKVMPNAMLYVKAGYSNGQLKGTYKDFADPTLNGSEHSNRSGVHFGVGGEMEIGTGYVRAEYVRTNYNDYDYPSSDFALSIDGHRDQVLLGFGLRF